MRLICNQRGSLNAYVFLYEHFMLHSNWAFFCSCMTSQCCAEKTLHSFTFLSTEANIFKEKGKGTPRQQDCHTDPEQMMYEFMLFLHLSTCICLLCACAISKHIYTGYIKMQGVKQEMQHKAMVEVGA